MKKIWLTYIGLFVISSLFAQGEKDKFFVWNRWCANRDTVLLFTSSYNVLLIYSPNYKPEDYYLKSLDKTLKISKSENNNDTLTSLAMPYSTQNPMRLAIINKRNGKVIKTVVCHAVDVPNPVARVGYVKDTIALKENLVAQTSLKVVFPNSLYCYPYRIMQYSFKAHFNKQDYVYSVRGNAISNDIERVIRNAPSGTVLTFYEIKATCQDCITKSISELRVHIK